MENETNVGFCSVIEKKKRIYKKCEHGKQKCRCVDCDGVGICIHDKDKRICKVCKGNIFCIHEKNKQTCKICCGNMLCKSVFCETRGIRKYNMYCLTCTVNLFPEIVVKRNYKTKEKYVVDHIKTKFPDFDFIADKVIENACSKRRCDLRLDYGSHVIVIEIDEFQHRNTLCEEKRTMEIIQDLQYKNTIFIRFNPDDYVDENNIKIASCWKINKIGIMTITKGKEKEWNLRLEKLIDTIQFHINNVPLKIVDIVKLFY